MTKTVVPVARYLAWVIFGSAVAIAALALASSTPALAAGPAVYGPGTIQGFAHDADGSAAEGAAVVLTDFTNGTEQTTTVDRNGGFFFFGVASGSYSIEVDAGSGSMTRDFVFIQNPGAGMTISLQLWESDTSDPAAAGAFQMRKTNPTLMGQPIPAAGR